MYEKNIFLHFYHNLVILSNLYTKISLVVSDAIKYLSSKIYRGTKNV